MSPSPTADEIAALPKVLLHDHLDGGLRPATLVELAAEVGHPLPTDDPDELAAWFVRTASTGSLELYLETFEHTVAVMQTPQALRRVAREAALDLARDGVVYAEQRYAPEQHLARGLTLHEVVEAVQEGFAEGVAAAAEEGRRIRIGTLLTAMRHADRSAEIADLVLAHRDAGVVGFDIAGAEAGHPVSAHVEAFRRLRLASMPVTIHAGEGDGVESIAEAVHVGLACRIGHGVRLLEDVEAPARGAAGPDDDDVALGRLAHWVRDQQLALELCPSSNVQTGAAGSVGEHPITTLRRLGFAVTINTDNRLMSGTSMTREMTLLVEQAGWTLADLADATLTAAWSAFLHLDERQDLVDEQVLPGYLAEPSARHRAG